MSQKPITAAYTPPGPDRANIKSIEKNFNELYDSLKWKELLNIAFNVTITGSIFTLPDTWQDIKNAYAEVYFCVRELNDQQHTIIVPTDMINKTNASAIFNLAGGGGGWGGDNASMFVLLGGLTDTIGTIKSSVNGSTRLIILAR
jgi:hypothetical protein